MLDSLNKDEISALFKKGKRVSGKIISIIIKEGSGNFRFAAIIAGKSRAVDRNKIKRKIREAVRSQKNKLAAGKQVALITSVNISKYPFSEIKKLVEKILSENKLI
jgi:ribonuclease P protein component